MIFSAMLLAAGSATIAHAQEKIETTISGDIVSQYIWRGQDLGSVSLQPTLGIGWKGLSLSAWGSVGLSDSDDTKEFDLTASYAVGSLTVGVTDYWFDSPEKRYFLYSAHRTSHLFEAFAQYDLGFLSAAWYTNFAGNDGENKSGHRAYSSYFELNAPFRLAGVDWTATAGAVPYATTLYEASGFAVTNLALRADKDIRITDSFTVPVFGQIVGNPCSQKAYFVFGVTLRP